MSAIEGGQMLQLSNRGVTLAVDDGIVVADVASHKLLDHILVGMFGLVEESFQIIVIYDFESAHSSNAHVRLGEERIASILGEFLHGLDAFVALYLASGADTAEGIVFLHLRLLLDCVYAIELDASVDIEVGAQARILLKPILIV